jgi:phosphohistidine phosphatase SixA
MDRRNLRTSMLAVTIAAVALLAGCDRKKETPAPPNAGPAPALATTFADDAALIKALRAGGYVIALRHTRTDQNQKDYIEMDLDDCTKQRNLDEQGRTDAKSIGEAVKRMKLPIGTVLSSPFCRTKETAELAFGAYTINKACMGDDEDSLAARAELLATLPAPGTNVVVVTHANYMQKSTSAEILKDFHEGAAAVIVPKGGKEFEVVRTIRFADWARLADAARGVR